MSKLKVEIENKLNWLNEERIEFKDSECVKDILDFAISEISDLRYIDDDIDDKNKIKINDIKNIALSDLNDNRMKEIYRICNEIIG